MMLSYDPANQDFFKNNHEKNEKKISVSKDETAPTYHCTVKGKQQRFSRLLQQQKTVYISI